MRTPLDSRPCRTEDEARADREGDGLELARLRMEDVHAELAAANPPKPPPRWRFWRDPIFVGLLLASFAIVALFVWLAP